jgi:hypothetical protein
LLNDLIPLFSELLRKPISFIFMLAGILVLMAGLLLPFLEHRIKIKRPPWWAVPAGGILMIVLGFLLLPFGPRQETCGVIYPTIQYPLPQSKVTTPLTINGTVRRIPDDSYLWLIAYNSRIARYCYFADIVANQYRQWTATANLVGGMVGDEYEIRLVLASAEENRELLKCKQAQSGEQPPGVRLCKKIFVTLTQ